MLEFCRAYRNRVQRADARCSATASRWTRTVTMLASRSKGGSTWTMPLLTLHGPKPSTSMRCLTAMVRSWCQPKDQF